MLNSFIAVWTGMILLLLLVYSLFSLIMGTSFVPDWNSTIQTVFIVLSAMIIGLGLIGWYDLKVINRDD